MNAASGTRVILGGAAGLAAVVVALVFVVPPGRDKIDNPAADAASGAGEVAADAASKPPEPEGPVASASVSVESPAGADPVETSVASVPPEGAERASESGSGQAVVASAEPAIQPPTFDVVRIDSDGSGLVAGRGHPGSEVALLVDDSEVTRAPVDGSGGFVAFLDIGPATHPRTLSLLDDTGGIERLSDETVIIGPASSGDAPREPAAEASGLVASADEEAASVASGEPVASAEAAVDEETSIAAAVEPSGKGDKVAVTASASVPESGGRQSSEMASTSDARTDDMEGQEPPLPDQEGTVIASAQDSLPSEQRPPDALPPEKDALTPAPSSPGAEEASGAIAGGRPLVASSREGEDDLPGDAGDRNSDDAAGQAEPDPEGPMATEGKPTVETRVGRQESNTDEDQVIADDDASGPRLPSPTDDAASRPEPTGAIAEEDGDLREAGTEFAGLNGNEGSRAATATQDATAPDTSLERPAASGAPSSGEMTAPAPRDSAPEPSAQPTTSGPAPASPEAPAAGGSDADPGGRAEDASPPSDPPLLASDAEGVRVMRPGVDVEAPDAMSSLALDSISYDMEGEVTLSGRAEGQGFVRIYLDNRPVMTVPVSPDGEWRSDLPQVETGVYTMRLDRVSESGEVTERIETPFRRERPETIAGVMRDETSRAGFKAAVRTIQPGNTLWAISRERYGEGILYVRIFEANKDLIRDPDLIYPGQVFRLPEGPGED